MERKETNYLKSTLISGLGFGLGGVIGNFALFLMIRELDSKLAIKFRSRGVV